MAKTYISIPDEEGKPQEQVTPKTPRTRMTAYLSEDDGKKFPHKLLLCDDGQISYPSVTLDNEGAMLIVYDQGRDTIGQHIIFLSKVTEEDILAGEVTSDGSFLNTIVSRPSDHGDGRREGDTL